MRRTVSLITALGVLLAGLLLNVPSAQAVDYDCADFDTQAQAQKYLTPGDPHRLDADDDGIACDSLPCPCSTGKPKPSQATPGQSNSGRTLRQRARIVRVVDGDTVVVRLKGRQKYVRPMGINSPEVSGAGQCYGDAATTVLRGMLPVGTRVRLISDSTQARVDRYGRLLRYIMKRKLDVDRQMVLRGGAKVYVYNNKAFKRVAAYRAAQSSAQRAPRGLWKYC